MKTRIVSMISALCLLTILAVQWGAAQGIYWESMDKSMGDDKGRLSKSYAMPGMFKAERAGEPSAIIRLDQEKFIMVNDAEKTYSEMTFKEMESMMGHANAALAGMNDEMKAQLAQLPADQRAMMEQMIKSKMGGGEEAEATYTVEKGGGSKKIAGFSATDYTVKNGDKTEATIWTTTALAGFDDIRKDFKKFQERMSSMMPGKAKAMAKWWAQVDGFPLEVHSDFLDQTVTKVEKKATPASAFEAPKGYKKTDMMKSHGGRHE